MIPTELTNVMLAHMQGSESKANQAIRERMLRQNRHVGPTKCIVPDIDKALRPSCDLSRFDDVPDWQERAYGASRAAAVGIGVALVVIAAALMGIRLF